ncbi:glycosyltransferase family 2 protein [Leptolyngbya sp. CCNP1308]|uniref:2'-O-glycosyltransferase CruG n=1 Tax=Leptolyngbya sp. CCNP1308 TaxID=3110255 RepID=UPI002B2045CD|nr:glycosyltransferase family 2 protein [Leptolyngbya sp. CCNP1308]MEA5451030.1 glycosyltransferase family 2 protein [Leptolyngbya sp. CCNP1308]
MLPDVATPFPWPSFIAIVLLAGQLPMVAVLLSRLMQGPFRRPPLAPARPDLDLLGTVSVVVPTLNEADRIRPCLEGLIRQGYEVREILVVDSRSTDRTRSVVSAYQAHDPRLRLLEDDPLPQGWVGRPWALDYGFRQTSTASTWVLGVDADTQPQPGLVAALAKAMNREGYDLVSLAPRFILKHPGEFWLQPALLMTLVYRFGPAGSPSSSAQRVMANGQCFMVRRSLLAQLDGYQAASSSFCDDVTLARYAAAQGAKVGFWDGTRLLKVRMYEGMAETWREWGRSLDLKDAAPAAQIWWDWLFLALVQGLPWVIVPGVFAVRLLLPAAWSLTLQLLLIVNASLLLVRLGMQAAVASAYDRQEAAGAWAFWLSPLADLAAVARIGMSSLRRPTQWRGRQYPVGD